MYEECECHNWLRGKQKVFTNHHPQCKSYDLETDAQIMFHKMIREMELWLLGHEIDPPDHIKDVLYMASLISGYQLERKLKPQKKN